MTAVALGTCCESGQELRGWGPLGRGIPGVGLGLGEGRAAGGWSGTMGVPGAGGPGLPDPSCMGPLSCPLCVPLLSSAFPLPPTAFPFPHTAIPLPSSCLPTAIPLPSNHLTIASQCLPLPSHHLPIFFPLPPHHLSIAFPFHPTAHTPLATSGAPFPFPLAPSGQSLPAARHSAPALPCKGCALSRVGPTSPCPGCPIAMAQLTLPVSRLAGDPQPGGHLP